MRLVREAYRGLEEAVKQAQEKARAYKEDKSYKLVVAVIDPAPRS